MEIDRKDTNIQIGKRLREARTNMNKDKAEFAATLDVTEEHYRKLEALRTSVEFHWAGHFYKKPSHRSGRGRGHPAVAPS